ncbi:MAG: FecR domain-containing protein [Burkholderiales bacterium]
MANRLLWWGRAALALASLAMAAQAAAQDIGRIKVARGQVAVERAGATLAGSVGMRVQASDTVRTGDDGSVGITMDDDSLLSAGPNTVLVLERYAFDTTTNQGRLDTALNKGTLAVVSGRIAKQSPGAMTVRTPAVILGVRGTSFVVGADE